ncbi:MAG: ATP-binding protein [Gemmatimonadetes bacterium]|nr:ATP-binding protein [Gemmatimonadota bacterium]
MHPQPFATAVEKSGVRFGAVGAEGAQGPQIGGVHGALVLIDEVEAGLHPWVQQLLMLHLQELDLCRDLQIIATSHSPVVLESVPSGAVRIGRDTGAGEFPTHAAAFRKFGQIQNFVFVLDGDARDADVRRKIRRNADTDVPVLYLPGRESPEAWIWRTLPGCAEREAEKLGIDPGELAQRMAQVDAVYASAGGPRSETAKEKLNELSQRMRRETADICRLVGRLEAKRDDSDIQPLVEELEAALQAWRSR